MRSKSRNLILFSNVALILVLSCAFLETMSGTGSHFSGAVSRPGDAENLQQPQVSDDLHQPEQPPLPARRQRRAAGAEGGARLGQSELDAGLWCPGELGEEAAQRPDAVSGQSQISDLCCSMFSQNSDFF